MSREELLLYRGENDTDNVPKFCEINVNCQSNPDSNLDVSVKHKEKELFKIIKEKKQCICQMFFDFEKEDDNICLTTASAFFTKEQHEVSCICIVCTCTILLCISEIV